MKFFLFYFPTITSIYQNLRVWQNAIELVTCIYQLTKKFPKDEIYGLVSQMRRCAVSIPSNIAEGSQRSSKKDFAHFLEMAKSSAAELETQLIIANNLQYISETEKKDNIEKVIDIRKMLSGLIAKLRKK